MNFPRSATFRVETSGEPLASRAPSVDENGDALSDFMVIFPGLRDKSETSVRNTIDTVYRILASYNHAVVFAEFNLRLNLLWVSIRPISGIRFEIAGALQEQVPDARLVSHI